MCTQRNNDIGSFFVRLVGEINVVLHPASDMKRVRTTRLRALHCGTMFGLAVHTDRLEPQSGDLEIIDWIHPIRIAIIALRNPLGAGEMGPAPVCGALHHPMGYGTQYTLFLFGFLLAPITNPFIIRNTDRQRGPIAIFMDRDITFVTDDDWITIACLEKLTHVASVHLRVIILILILIRIIIVIIIVIVIVIVIGSSGILTVARVG